MIIDAHTHILSLAADPQFTVDYGRLHDTETVS